LGSGEESLAGERLKLLWRLHHVEHTPAVLGRAGEVEKPPLGELALREDRGDDLLVVLPGSAGDVDLDGDGHPGLLSLAEPISAGSHLVSMAKER